ncbi:hypothetical protein AB0B44_32380, partial [Streptomyces sp. NPDC041003]
MAGVEPVDAVNVLVRHHHRVRAAVAVTSGRSQTAQPVKPVGHGRVLATVLPRIDEHYGGLRGVPGLRIVPAGRSWSL